MNAFKIGCIGTGNIMQHAHLPSLQRIAGACVVALSDIDKDKLKEVSRLHKIERCFTDYHEMLEEVDLDIVYIAVPPRMLKSIALDCFSRKVHVFVEKPPGINLDETEHMMEVAAKNGCKTMVGFNRRFSKVLLQARNIVEERGPITHCLAEFHKHPRGLSNWSEETERIWILDLVIHSLDTLRWIGGEVCNVESIVRKFYSHYLNSFAVLLEFKNSSTGVVNANFHSGARVEQYEMHGREIAAYVDPSKGIKIYKNDNPQPEIFTFEQIVGTEERYVTQGYLDESKHFLECIRNDKVPIASLENAIKTMALVEQI